MRRNAQRHAHRQLSGRRCARALLPRGADERLSNNPFPDTGVKRLSQALPAADSAPCLEDRRPLSGSSSFLDVAAKEHDMTLSWLTDRAATA